MKYTIEVDVDQFQDKVLKAKAKLQEVSPKDYLMGIVDTEVSSALNKLVDDALKTKLGKMSTGLALAKLEAMDEA